MINPWTTPTSVTIGARAHEINADFRDVLDVLAQLNNEENDEETRLYVALALFYEDFAEMSHTDYREALEYMFDFIACGAEKDEKRVPPPKSIDWEQDAVMIVAEVNKIAAAEIRSLPFYHWFSFIAAFNSIGDGQLAMVVSIRSKLRKSKKLEKYERDFYRENKHLVDFKVHYTAEEIAERERLERMLGALSG